MPNHFQIFIYNSRKKIISNLHTHYNKINIIGNQIYCVLICKRLHSHIVDVQSFRGVACDIDQYLVVAKVRERLSVSKQPVQKFNIERFNIKKLNDLVVKEEYQVKILNVFAALENLLMMMMMMMMMMWASLGLGKVLERI
jgi:hypothetical protein